MKIIFIFLLFVCYTLGVITSVSVVTENSIEYAKSQLSQAYLQYLYSPYSSDKIELLLNGQLILAVTPVSNKQTILQTIQGLQVANTGATCTSNYHLDLFKTKTTNTIYLLIDRNPCHLATELQNAQALKTRGIKIFPIGVGRSVADTTLAQISGPCMSNFCMPGWNYLHV